METNNGVIMPEIIIQKTISTILSIIKEDYLEKTDKTQTLLNYFFSKDADGKKIEFETMDYLSQAVDLFTTRKIQVNMGYNLEVADIPNIHILLPSENSRFMSIGADENYNARVETTERVDDETENVFSAATFSQTYDSTYQLMITSPSVFEVLLIYNVLKLGILSLYENIEFKGLRNIKTGGQDLNMQSDLVPSHIFHRSLTISFFYELSAPSYFKNLLAQRFSATGIIG